MLKKGVLSSIRPLSIYSRTLSGYAAARHLKSQITCRVAGKKKRNKRYRSQL